MKPATVKQKLRWERVRGLGCCVHDSDGIFHSGYTTIHHCGTKMGCPKDHDKVIPLCWEHHLGARGIDGKKISKREWQKIYGSEKELLEWVTKQLGEQ